MVGDHQMDHAAEGAVAQQRKACVGAANVGQQGAHEALRRDRPLPALCKACRKASRHAVTSLAAIALYMARQRSWRSEEHTSELRSLMRISYAVFCLKKKKNITNNTTTTTTSKHMYSIHN